MDSASSLIDQRIAELHDWRGETLARLRQLILEAVPEVVEEWKWRGVPVWSHSGIICTGETYKSIVKLTFAKGASLPDPAGLFNASLEGNVRRAIDIHKDEQVDEAAFKELVRAAATANATGKSRPKTPRSGVTADAFRKAALSLPETSESEHMGHPDFRVAGKVFATLAYPRQELRHGEAVSRCTAGVRA